MSQIALQARSDEVGILRTNVHDLQKQLQVAYARIGELVEERDELRSTMIKKIRQ